MQSVFHFAEDFLNRKCRQRLFLSCCWFQRKPFDKFKPLQACSLAKLYGFKTSFGYQEVKALVAVQANTHLRNYASILC